MTETEPSKRRVGTTGELVAAAIIGALVGWPITKALDGLTADNKWPWWVYLVGTVVGIAFVLLAMTFIIRAWRISFWGGFGRGLRWLWSWHPVSARHFNTARVSDARLLIKAFNESDQTIATSLPGRIRDVLREDKESDERMKELIKPLVEQRVRLIQATHAEAETARPALPPPDPRWVFKWTGESNGVASFEIQNLMPESVAYNARIEASPSTGFRHWDSAFWKDLSGQNTAHFKGEIKGAARWKGLAFNFSWLDENYDGRSEVWKIAGPDPAPTPSFNDDTPF